MRFQQLEPLVRERGRVDGDLRAHVPRRMRKRLLRCDVLELGTRAPAEGPAARREHERCYRARVAPPKGRRRRPGFRPRDGGFAAVACSLEALERGGVLAVYRQQKASSPPPRGDGELAARDERFLVREG